MTLIDVESPSDPGPETFVVGAELPPRAFEVSRADLIRYAGASKDFNPIHWDERTAAAVGLPDVISHGMLTMALAVRVITDWAADPGAVLEYGVRFTRPIAVPAQGSVTLDVTAVVAAVDHEAQTATLNLTAKVAGKTVLAKARVVLRTHG